MKNNEKDKSLTFEEALQDPSLAHIHESILYLQKTPFSQMFPKKNELSLTAIVEMEARNLFIENPNLPIKKVITTIFEPLTDDIPAPLVLKLTQKIIQQWSKLTATSLKTNEVVAAH